MNAILFLLAGSVAGHAPFAEFACDLSTADLGELKAGAPLTHSFKLVNRSKPTVTITSTKLSCGCSKHSFDRETVKPGETSTLAVQINTLAQAAGPWSWSATVRFKSDGDPAEKTLTVTLNAKLVREIAITPPGLAFSLESGSVTQEIVIEDTRPVPLTIKGAAPSAAHLKAILKAGDKPGQYRLAVTVDANAPVGDHRDAIVLATGDPFYPELHVPVQVTKANPTPVKAYPEEVFTDTDSAEVSLRRPDGKALQIANCEIDNASIAMKWSKDSALTQRITLRIPESLKPGQCVLTVTLQDPAGETLRIPVTWGDRKR